MISHKYKCIFLHIPKTAGTSIETALGHFDSDREKGVYKGRNAQDHRTLRAIEKPRLNFKTFSSKENIVEAIKSIKYDRSKHTNPNNGLSVNAKQYQTYFKFTVVRNPWSRVYSCYGNLMKDENHKKYMGVTTDLSFNEFVEHYLDNQYVINVFLKPQTYWLKNFAGNINLDYICRFENLDRDFREVCKHLDANHLTLPHKLQGTKKNYQTEYDRHSKAIVAKKYREEIELLNYTFEK